MCDQPFSCIFGIQDLREISWLQPWAHDQMWERLLKYGIRQFNYRQGKRLLNKNMKVKLVFYLPTVMM
jgi:hypothetical protein